MSEYLEKAKEKLGWGYVLGADGRILTQKLLDIWKYNYPANEREHDTELAKRWMGKRVLDCSGYVILNAQECNYLPKSYDDTASGLYFNQCTPITKAELRPEDLVFIADNTGHIHHVGIYAGDGKVYEAKKTSVGVVIGNVNRFNRFGRPIFNPNILTVYDAISYYHTKGIVTADQDMKTDFKGGNLSVTRFGALLVKSSALLNYRAISVEDAIKQWSSKKLKDGTPVIGSPCDMIKDFEDAKKDKNHKLSPTRFQGFLIKSMRYLKEVGGKAK